jgi:hypothetical protein
MIAASILAALALSQAQPPSQEADMGRRANDALPILSDEWTALLCLYVAENPSETDPREARSVYRYRSWLYRAAGVDLAADDADTIRSRMQLWWNANQDALRCNVPNSVIRNGSILRLAADRSSSEFLTDAARRWRLDLNYRDPNDGGTVLDWLDDQILIAHPNRAPTLIRYRTMIQNVGGLRARDLGFPMRDLPVGWSRNSGSN